MVSIRLLLLVNIIPVIFLIVYGIELYESLVDGVEGYSMEDAGLAKGGWVHISPTAYVGYLMLFTSTLIALIAASVYAGFTGNWEVYFVLLFVNVLVFSALAFHGIGSLFRWTVG